MARERLSRFSISVVAFKKWPFFCLRFTHLTRPNAVRVTTYIRERRKCVEKCRN